MTVELLPSPVADPVIWGSACAELASRLEQLREVWAGSPELAGAALEVRPLGATDVLSAPAQLWTRPTVVVFLTGTAAVVGPLGSPAAEPGCPQCLARRWQSVQTVAIREALEFGIGTMTAGDPPAPTPSAVLALACLIAQLRVDRSGDAFQLDLHTLGLEATRLLADPACPSCGTTPEDAEYVPQLEPSPKQASGSIRSKALQDYPLPTSALLNPVCGVIGRGIVPELDLPSTSAIWGCFATRTYDDMYEIYWAGHANRYDTSVRVGLIEGLERYSGMAPRAKRVSIMATLGELRRAGHRVLDPRDSGLYAEEFYADTDELVPFTDDLRIPWVWGYSLRDSASILVPEVLAYYHSTVPEQRFVQECSNGCASGGSLVEATYCGLMELIERDAFLLSWYGKVSLPEIDPQTSSRPATRMMVDRMALYGYRARFFDARITFGVPVIVGAAQRTDGELGALSIGGGAGLDAEDALASALVEIATDSMNSRRRTERAVDSLREMAADFDKILRIHDHPQVYGLPEMAVHADFLLNSGKAPVPLRQQFAAPTAPASTDLREDLTWCVAHLAERNLDTIVVDQTAPEQAAIGLHTAAVIVPGLLPLDFGWYRQRALHMPRMRTALREAGLASTDLDYDDLHLVPHPFP